MHTKMQFILIREAIQMSSNYIRALMQHQLTLEPYTASVDYMTLENLQQSHVSNKSRHLPGAVQFKAVLWNVASLPGVTYMMPKYFWGGEERGEE